MASYRIEAAQSTLKEYANLHEVGLPISIADNAEVRVWLIEQGYRIEKDDFLLRVWPKQYVVYDLFYCEERDIYESVKAAAEAQGFTTKDGSDYIHPYRLEVSGYMPAQEDYVLWVMRNRFLGLSFDLEMMQGLQRELFVKLANQVIAEFKEQEDAKQE